MNAAHPSAYAVRLAEMLQQRHRAEVQRCELSWWNVAVTLDRQFLGGIFVWAFGPIDAANEIRMRQLLNERKPYVLEFTRVEREPPDGAKFKLLTLAELKAVEGAEGWTP